MDKRTRAGKLATVGETEYESCSGLSLTERDNALIRAFAAMLAEATSKKTTKKKTSSGGRFYDSGKALYDKLRDEAGDVLVYSPVRPGTFTTLGKALEEAQVTQTQQDNLVRWFQTDPFSWRDTKPTWAEFVRKAIDWIGQAQDCKEARVTKEEHSHIRSLREKGIL